MDKGARRPSLMSGVGTSSRQQNARRAKECPVIRCLELAHLGGLVLLLGRILTAI